MRKILLVFIVFSLIGCGYGRIAKKNNDLMLTLNSGQTKQDVLKIMGNPSKNEKYSSGNKEIDAWFYRTSSFATGGWDSDDYFTPVVFENGVLVGWGRDFYEQKIDSNSMIKND